MAQNFWQLTGEQVQRLDGPSTLTAAGVSPAFDCLNLTGPLNILVPVGAVTAANTTVVTVTESASAAGPFVQAQNGTYTITTADANTVKVFFCPSVTQRYARLEFGTPSGGSPSTAIQAVLVVAQTKAFTRSGVNAVSDFKV